MRFPIPWLREFATLPDDDSVVARAFTLSGTEVEGREICEGETVFEFGITVNRPDCMNAFGLAREAAALSGAEIRPLLPTIPAEDQRGPGIATLASLEVKEESLCPRYRALVITGLRVGESPAPIQKRLIQCGLRPINAVVDATNFVLLELGHPLHAFDLATLRGRGIVVRRASPGEMLRTLDGVERKLSPEMLVIADKERPVALAGVMGGEATGVTAATTSLLLEGAVFDAVSIRRTAKTLALHTDASHRFERGVDFGGAELALARCAELIIQSCGGKLAAGALEALAERPVVPKITLRHARVQSIAGMEIPPSRCQEILRRLGFSVEESGDGKLEVAVPSWRVDISREIDLIEEIVRVHGLEGLPTLQPPLVDSVGGRPPEQLLEERLRDAFAGAGFSEVICMSLADPVVERATLPATGLMGIANAMSETASVLRGSLKGGLLTAAGRNRARGVRKMTLFEIGHVFEENGGHLQETANAAALLFEDDPPKRWEANPISGILGLKGAIERVLFAVGSEVELVPCEKAPFARGHTLALVSEGKTVGHMGTITPETLSSLGIKGQAHLVEFSLQELTAPKIPQFKPASKYPSIVRDFSVMAPTEVSWEQMKATLRGVSSEHLVAVELVEVYEGRGLPEGSRSWTVSLSFQASNRTLVDEDVREVSSLVEKALRDILGASLRTGEINVV